MTQRTFFTIATKFRQAALTEVFGLWTGQTTGFAVFEETVVCPEWHGPHEAKCLHEPAGDPATR